MRRLFLKIFLWYWLATSVVGIVLVAGLWPGRGEPGRPLWLRDLGNLLGVYGAEAARVYEREGGEALAAYLDGAVPDGTIHAYLFDETGRELTGRAAPERLREHAVAVARRGAPELDPGEGAILGARRVTGPDGGRFVVAARFAGGRPSPPALGTLALRVVAVLLTAGAVCYGLARYLTRPIGRLREATRAVASGDLTARVGPHLGRRRDELADLAHDFDDMAARLEASAGAERRLLRDVSHELRSPLARIGVALDLARQESGPEIAGDLDRIDLEAARLNELIGQILTLTRLESAATEVERQPVDLAALVEEVAADAGFEARAKGRHVTLAADPCTVLGDAGLLRSAIENVVRNGVRHTPEGAAVEVELHREGDDAVVLVRDSGPGVLEADLERIFRPFFRVEGGRERQSGGTGLGLAIAERAVRRHGGTVTATNLPTGGLLVEIRLPAE